MNLTRQFADFFESEKAEGIVLTGVGFLAGIGFTMSILITLLAFPDPILVSNAKLAILIGSALAGITGFSILSYGIRKY